MNTGSANVLPPQSGIRSHACTSPTTSVCMSSLPCLLPHEPMQGQSETLLQQGHAAFHINLRSWPPTSLLMCVTTSMAGGAIRPALLRRLDMPRGAKHAPVRCQAALQVAECLLVSHRALKAQPHHRRPYLQDALLRRLNVATRANHMPVCRHAAHQSCRVFACVA